MTSPIFWHFDWSSNASAALAGRKVSAACTVAHGAALLACSTGRVQEESNNEQERRSIGLVAISGT
jgi:hypothetical protein